MKAPSDHAGFLHHCDKTDPSCDFLQRVAVRLLEGHERERFDSLLETKHYLHSSRIGGRHLRYVAEVEGQWVALLSFSGAAPFVKARDKKAIGWSEHQRVRRLGLVVNNSRFLLLADRHKHPNLSSKVLALALKKLPQHWEEHWGHRPLVVESFVDESLYPGTCYRACGFQQHGVTAGFSRHSRDFYYEHGNPKAYFLRELVPGACSILRRNQLPEAYKDAEAKTAGPCPLNSPELRSLYEDFGQVKDPRRGHGLRHRMQSTLACATAGMLMGACSYQGFEDVCKKFTQPQLRALRCARDPKTGQYVPPSDSTFYRVLNRVDPEAFERIVAQWLVKQEPAQLQRLALDGKALRGTGNHDKNHKPMMLLSLVTHRLKTTLASMQIPEKTNEIPAAPQLLRELKFDIAGSLITADAMHCQQKTARCIVHELGADYIFGLKGNQEAIRERAEVKLAPVFFPSGGNDVVET